MSTKTFAKQPSEVLDYFFDFTAWLTSKTDTMISYEVEAAEGITIESHNEGSPGVIQMFLSGGVHGQRYKVTARITTAGGRVKESDFWLRIREG